MSNVALKNGLIFNKDVKLLTIGKVDSFYEYLDKNPNMTWYSVVWCTSKWEVSSDFALPCSFTEGTDKRMMFYSLFYNYTLADTVFLKSLNELSPVDSNLLHLKNSIDNAIIAYLAKEKGLELEDYPRIDLSHSSYPHGPDRFV